MFLEGGQVAQGATWQELLGRDEPLGNSRRMGSYMRKLQILFLRFLY